MWVAIVAAVNLYCGQISKNYRFISTTKKNYLSGSSSSLCAWYIYSVTNRVCSLRRAPLRINCDAKFYHCEAWFVQCVCHAIFNYDIFKMILELYFVAHVILSYSAFSLGRSNNANNQSLCDFALIYCNNDNIFTTVIMCPMLKIGRRKTLNY